MSFGFSVGDFVALGQLAHQVWVACAAASADYHELGDLCHHVNIAVEQCKPNDPFTVLRRQKAQAIDLLVANCRATLYRLENILTGYADMSGIRGLGRRIGFVTSKQEIENIRRSLQEHLSMINTFLNGAQMETLGLVVRLLLVNMDEGRGQLANGSPIDPGSSRASQVQELLQAFGLESEVSKKMVDENKGAIEERLASARAGDEQTTAIVTTADAATDVTSGSPVIEPAKSKTLAYDPAAIQWYFQSGWRFLRAVSLLDARIPHPNLTVKNAFELTGAYSEDDAWLCKLPEGWSVSFKTLNLQTFRAESFFYVFNNMSFGRTNIPRTSRTYCFDYPFACECLDGYSDHLNFLVRSSMFPATLPIVLARGHTGGHVAQRYIIGYTNGQQIPGAGFLCANWAYDLSDDVSLELAIAQHGSDGTRKQYSEDLIALSLPPNWTCEYDDSSEGRHVYFNIETAEESTVHPARFFFSEDEVTKLPPGWERRLDGWGNLFFVDHHTRRAVREDPRYNRNIDQSTGLPQGWHKIQDHQNRVYFYNDTAKIVLGTYKPETMVSRMLGGKDTLSRRPQHQEDPSTLLSNIRRRHVARQEAVPTEKAVRHPADISEIPQMTEAERMQYEIVFGNAEKQSRHYLTKAEARKSSNQFGVPWDLREQILDRTDSNKNQRWNVDEYGAALHQMYFELEKHWREVDALKTVKIPSDDEEKYLVLFDQLVPKGQHVATKEHFEKIRDMYSLPSSLVAIIIADADANHDGRWIFDEFAVAMHKMMREVERRDRRKLFAPQPVDQPIDKSEEPFRGGSEKMTDCAGQTSDGTAETVGTAETIDESSTSASEPPTVVDADEGVGPTTNMGSLSLGHSVNEAEPKKDDKIDDEGATP